MRWIGFGLMAWCWAMSPAGMASDDEWVVPHFDTLNYDPNLSLAAVVERTLEQYPQSSLIGALNQEAAAAQNRGESWLAGPGSLYVQYIDNRPVERAGFFQIQTGLAFPLWQWGQRSAARNVADESFKNSKQFKHALRYEVSGLVREALWDLRLQESRRQLALEVYRLSQRLVGTVRRRVELGDLARADLLLAQSDSLEKRTALAEAEAKMMDSRIGYKNLTRLESAPESYEETLSKSPGVAENHPALAAATAEIDLARSQAEWVDYTLRGQQPSLTVGTQHDREPNNQSTTINSLNVIVTVPFGGRAYNAPSLAAAQRAVTEKMIARDTLVRLLERSLHEAEHMLQVDQAELAIAEERKGIAEQHLKMSRLAFESGEIPLIDLLKIESSAQSAIREAAERAIVLRRDIARYNQVVGEMP